MRRRCDEKLLRMYRRIFEILSLQYGAHNFLKKMAKNFSLRKVAFIQLHPCVFRCIYHHLTRASFYDEKLTYFFCAYCLLLKWLTTML